MLSDVRIPSKSQPIRVTLLCAAFVALIAACSSESAPTPTVVLPTPQESLDNARSAMADVDQFEFELSHSRGSTALDGGLELQRAEGLVVTDRLSVEAEANLGRLFVRVEAIVIDGQTWMTNPLTGNWSSISPQDSPFSFLDPIRLVTNVLDQTNDPVYPASGGSSGGQIILNGTVPSEALRPLVGTVLPGVLLDVELALNAETFLLDTARLTGRLQADDDENTERLIDFSGFDAVLTIEPPV